MDASHGCGPGESKQALNPGSEVRRGWEKVEGRRRRGGAQVRPAPGMKRRGVKYGRAEKKKLMTITGKNPDFLPGGRLGAVCFAKR